MSESIPQQPKSSSVEQTAPSEDTIAQIRDALRGLRYGSVNIIVQDGVVIQIDRTEKRRLRNSRNQ